MTRELKDPIKIYAKDFSDSVTTPMLSVDLSKFDSPGQSQYFSSCTADALVSAYENMLNQKGVEYSASLSRMWNWYYARSIKNNQYNNVGSSCTDSLAALMTNGLCLESDWNYSQAHYAQMPPNGYENKVSMYYIKNRIQITSINELCFALTIGKPVVFSTSASGVGLHAMCVVGYNSNTNTFICKDSNWDSDGNFYKELSWEYMNTKVWDMWTFEIDDNPPVFNKWLKFWWYRLFKKIVNTIL